MIDKEGYILSCTQYKDNDLICNFFTNEGLMSFLNISGLKKNAKLNCNIYKLSYVKVKLYKGNQKYYKIKELNILNFHDLTNSNFEMISFYNFINEITLIILNNKIFENEFYVIFDSLMKKIYSNNDNSRYYILKFLIYIVNSNGVIQIDNNLSNTKNNLIKYFNYYKLDNFLNLICDENVLVLTSDIISELDLNLFKNCFKILVLILETSFNINLKSKDLIYII